MKIVSIGDVLYGYCNGFFGRDSYGDKILIARGEDWLVVREVESGRPNFADFSDWKELDMDEMLAKWSVPGAP